MSVGIVIGRFQVASLHEGHVAILSAVAQRCTRLVVLVGVSQSPANARDPLPFFCREDAIRTVFPQATVLPLPDCREDAEWSRQIDAAGDLFRAHGPVTIYGGRDSCLPHYSGAFPVEALPVQSSVSGTEIRRATDLGYSLDFRTGMVYAAHTRFPTSYQTVDIALCRAGSVLLGFKVGELKPRFPGGFVDPSDKSLELAASREFHEECGLFEVTKPKYIGSARIDDWRYRGSVDAVLTAMFVCHHVFGEPQPGDDLARLVWVTRENLPHEIHPIHRPIADLLTAYLETHDQEFDAAHR